MKALVTGGLGFIGANIVDALLDKNVEVLIVDKNKKSKEPKDRQKMTIFINDANKTKMERLKREHFDLIFHFGAPCSNIQFVNNPYHLSETISGMVNVMEIARASGAKVIYPSSCTVYSGQFPQKENVALPLPTSLYSTGKIASEHIANYYENMYGIKSTGLRIFAAYGEREERKGNIASVITLFLMQIMHKKQPVIWGDGTQRRDFVYINDVVNLTLKVAFDEKSPKIINIGSGEAHDFNEVIRIINKKLGTSIIPKFISKPKWYLGNTKADMSLASKLYNFKAKSLETGISNYIRYLKQVM